MELDPAFTAECQSFVQVLLCIRVAVIRDGDGREDIQRFRHAAAEARTPGPLQAELETAARTVGQTDLGERSDCDFLVSEPFRELERAFAEIERLIGCGCGLSQMGEVGVGEPELTSRRFVLEQSDRLSPRASASAVQPGHQRNSDNRRSASPSPNRSPRVRRHSKLPRVLRSRRRTDR